MAEVTVHMCDIKGCDSIAAERLGIVMFKGPGIKYDINNLFPACGFDNAAKGSLTAEEYMKL